MTSRALSSPRYAYKQLFVRLLRVVVIIGLWLLSFGLFCLFYFVLINTILGSLAVHWIYLRVSKQSLWAYAAPLRSISTLGLAGVCTINDWLWQFSSISWGFLPKNSNRLESPWSDFTLLSKNAGDQRPLEPYFAQHQHFRRTGKQTLSFRLGHLGNLGIYRPLNVWVVANIICIMTKF